VVPAKVNMEERRLVISFYEKHFAVTLRG
jgi:hypothetical protein